MNTIHVARMFTDEHPTVGVVTVAPFGKPSWHCFSLEDRFRADKVLGDTRIPEGTYPLRWRRAGRFAQRWQKRGYPGSLQLHDVPGFSTILLHAGNTKADTEGCLLLGMGARLDLRTIQASRDAVTQVYYTVQRNAGDWQVVVQ